MRVNRSSKVDVVITLTILIESNLNFGFLHRIPSFGYTLCLPNLEMKSSLRVSGRRNRDTFSNNLSVLGSGIGSV